PDYSIGVEEEKRQEEQVHPFIGSQVQPQFITTDTIDKSVPAIDDSHKKKELASYNGLRYSNIG
ncbi:hypothetical protein ACHAXS_001090, partial [Conticribra weissflogii]